jgi:hyperosmotically inducible periplasmic protein
MNRLAAFLFSSILITGAVACDNTAKSSSNAPDSTTNNTSLDKPTAQANQNDASSEARRNQLNADIRAREQRNNAAGDQQRRADGDLASEVRSKLEANLPASQLTVVAKNGAVTVAGTVVNQQQLSKIAPLAKQIKGVQSVAVKTTVATAADPNQKTPQ